MPAPPRPDAPWDDVVARLLVPTNDRRVAVNLAVGGECEVRAADGARRLA